MIDLITREQLEYTAKSVLNYPLHDAEKDYFLTQVMKVVSESSLSNALIFKGGTSIYHCYLDQLRFSEDLDFTAIDKDICIEEIREIFDKLAMFEFKKEYESTATIKIERLKYYGILDTPNSIKFEVDRMQNVILPTVHRQYKNVWDLDFSVNVMDPVEICAEKLRACNDRFRYRDFYDLYMMITKLNINIKNSISLIPQKEIRKPFSKENILRNFALALNEISMEADTVTYKEVLNTEILKKFFEELNLSPLQPNV